MFVWKCKIIINFRRLRKCNLSFGETETIPLTRKWNNFGIRQSLQMFRSVDSEWSKVSGIDFLIRIHELSTRQIR